MSAERGPIARNITIARAGGVGVMTAPRVEIAPIKIAAPKFSSRESSPRAKGLTIKNLGTFTPVSESSRKEGPVKGFTPERFKPLSLPEKPKASTPNPFAKEWYSPASQKSRMSESKSSFNTGNRERLVSSLRKGEAPFIAKKEKMSAFNNWKVEDSLKIKQVQEALREIANPKTTVTETSVQKTLSKNNVRKFIPEELVTNKKFVRSVGNSEFKGNLPPMKKLSQEQKNVPNQEIKLLVPNIQPYRIPEFKQKTQSEQPVVVPNVLPRRVPEFTVVQKKENRSQTIIRPKEAKKAEIVSDVRSQRSTEPKNISLIQKKEPVSRVQERPQRLAMSQILFVNATGSESELRKEIRSQVSRARQNNAETVRIVDRKGMNVAEVTSPNDGKVLPQSIETVVFMLKEKERGPQICFAPGGLNLLASLQTIGMEVVSGLDKGVVVAQGTVTEAAKDKPYKPLNLTGNVSEHAICPMCVEMLKEQKRTLTV